MEIKVLNIDEEQLIEPMGRILLPSFEYLNYIELRNHYYEKINPLCFENAKLDE